MMEEVMWTIYDMVLVISVDVHLASIVRSFVRTYIRPQRRFYKKNLV